ncbi:MAG TPA: acyl-CoA dehydrogenase family protein [Rhodocyclaceae bacterium]|nr:acyl-CoA dehydrogenase family protein [Rhodocyclaceae bacterium]
MEFELASWQRAAADAFGDYLAREVAPIVPAHERERKLPPRALVRAMSSYGLLGGLLPEARGGLGLDHVTYGTLLAQLAGTWASLRSMISTSNLVLSIIAECGSAEQQDRFLPALIAGDKLAFFGLTEPNVGSDASGVETRAERDGAGGWRLRGRKLYITNGVAADLGVVFARTGRGEERAVSAFIVERGMPGFSAREIPAMGMHCCPLGELLFDDVALPAANLIGAEGEAFAIAKRYLNLGRCFVAFVCQGVAEAAYRDACRYAGERTQFGRPIGQFQLVQQMVADMMTRVETSRLLACRAADALDRKSADAQRWCSMAKRHNSDAALRVCEDAMQVFGGAGYTSDFAVERYYRDVRHLAIAEGTNQIQALLLAQGELRLSALRG